MARGLAQSYLFVPVTRPDRVAKVTGLDAHVVIVDLDAAVGEPDKDVGAPHWLNSIPRIT